MTSVLIVEPEWRMRELLMHVLEGAGYSVYEASDAGGAIKLTREHRPDVVFLNLDIGASEFLGARAADPVLSSIAVVVASARPRPIAGVAVYLKRPFAMDDILSALRQCRERIQRRVGRYSVKRPEPAEQSGTEAP